MLLMFLASSSGVSLSASRSTRRCLITEISKGFAQPA